MVLNPSTGSHLLWFSFVPFAVEWGGSARVFQQNKNNVPFLSYVKRPKGYEKPHGICSFNRKQGMKAYVIKKGIVLAIIKENKECYSKKQIWLKQNNKNKNPEQF